MNAAPRPDSLRPAGAPTGPAAAGSIVRPFRAEDVPAVAALCQRVFRRTEAPAPPALETYFAEIFLDHPCFDPEMPSQVYIGADGALRGFIGVLPLRMSFEGRALRAAVASSIMVDGAAADPLAGARLLRAVFRGPQDLSFGENLTETTRRMLLPFRAKPVLLNGLEWIRVLRPAGFAADFAVRRAALLRPLHLAASAMDSGLTRLARRLVPPASTSATGREVEPEDLADVIPEALKAFRLRPDFDDATLRWLLSHAKRKAEHGEPLARAVTLPDGRPAGCYLAHLQRHGVMRVMQAFSVPAHAAAVVEDILAEGWRRGAVAVKGRNQPELLEALQLSGCLFRHGGFTMVHSRDVGLMEAAARADAFVNGVAGEAWTRLSGDRFS